MNLLVWAAGVTASPAARWLDCPQDRAGRALVNPDLSVPGHPQIFVVGDTASVRDVNGPVPGVAPAAKQMGRYAAQVLLARLGHAPAPPPFRYHNAGNLAAIGRKSAIVALKRISFSGVLGWLFWCVAHIWFLIGFRSRIVVAFNWLWNYFTFQRGARLISDRERTPPTA